MIRTAASVRFAPYYKVQTWEPRVMAWKDIQRMFPVEAEARAAFPTGKRCRLMLVTMDGRNPLPE